jgi:hypothetical protein
MAKMNMNMTGRCDTVEQLPKKGRKQMEYRFRRAQNADVDQMIEIIRDRIKWMDKQGLHQWNKTDYMQQYPREYFLEGIEKGLFYIALDEQDRVAGLMALLTEDPRWAEDEPKDCYYVHHLAARSDAKGAGRALLEFCRQLSVQEGKLTEESRQELAQTMDRSVERMAAAFELLECGIWQPVIESVVYAGLYQVGNAVLNGTFHQRPRREKYPERKAGHGDA